MPSSTLDAPPNPATTHVTAPSPTPRVDPIRLVLFPARAFLALGWIRACAEKVIDRDWWTGDYLRQFIAEHDTSMLPFMGPVAERIGAAASIVIAFVVLLAEAAVGVCLLTGRRLRTALWGACVMNVAFVAFGAVAPSAFYLVLQMTLLFGLGVRSRTWRRGRTRIGIAVATLAAMSFLPFARTLHPHEVIEDPALMLSTLAALTAATLTIMLVERGDA